MTIGDEKVVAWRDVIVPSHASSDQLYNWNAEAVSRDEAESKIAALHSAYASLLEEKNQVAAERDAMESERDRMEAYAREFAVKLDAAESQLAELRGRVSLYGQERAHLQDVNAHLIKVLSAIHMRCAPKDIEMADGTKRRFVPPDPEFYWRELSGKVAAIKAEIQFTPRTLAAADGGGG